MNRKGNQVPTYRYSCDYERTEGGLATELSSSYDLTPHPWQAMILNDWLAIDEDGKLLNNFCLLEVPRQNGKTGVSDPRETWGLIARGEQILHTAQEFQTAKKAFDRLRKKFGTRKGDPYAKYPELNALVDHYTVSANQMILDLTNGGHIEFRTRGNNSDMGRGGTFDLVVIDEAQAYTEEQDASLSPLNSAAPSGSPQTILMGTPPVIGAKGIIFTRAIERMRENPQEGDCIHEWSTSSIGDIRDKNRWYRMNPSLGYQLLEKSLEKDAATMSEDTFAREHLGFLPKEIRKESYLISEKLWDSCKSSEVRPDGKLAYGIKFSPDGAEVCLCGAVVPEDGPSRVELIERKSTSQSLTWLADWLNDRYKKASCVVIDGKNGVDVLVEKIADVWKAKGSVIRPSSRDVIASVSMLMDSLNDKSVTWYEKQLALRDSATTSIKRSIGRDGFGFGGENATPIEAASLALWGARTTKRNPGKQMRIG